MRSKSSSVKILFMDVDGTLTDGKIYMGETGELIKAFDTKDGYGIHNILPMYGIIPVIITARTSGILRNRCEELGITHVIEKCSDKLDAMKRISEELFTILPDSSGRLQETAYIGDDLVDLPCLNAAAISGCPADAAKELLSSVSFVSSRCGGQGAVREFIEYICGI